MTDNEVAEILETKSSFQIRKNKVYVNGVFKNKYKYLETIESIFKNEEKANAFSEACDGVVSVKNIRGSRWFRVRITGTRAAKLCEKYIHLLDSKKEKAQVILDLAKDKLAKVRAPMEKQVLRQKFKNKIQSC